MMEIQTVKAWAFDKQIEVEMLRHQVLQMDQALTKISELVGLPAGQVPLQTLVDTVGAVVEAKNGANAQE